MSGTFDGMEVLWTREGLGRWVQTGQLHIKALLFCGTSVLVLLLDSGDFVHS